jgi:hypothetical protein
MLKVDNETTEQELRGLVGREVNLLWQFYTRASEEGSGGYAWIHLGDVNDTRDTNNVGLNDGDALLNHLDNDNESLVEMHGGEWDRTKQYVVVN